MHCPHVMVMNVVEIFKHSRYKPSVHMHSEVYGSWFASYCVCLSSVCYHVTATIHNRSAKRIER